jgi:methionyl-tRNA formyltransferase
MNIVFLGSGAFGIPSLKALVGSDHRILHIISQPDRPAGRGKVMTPTPVSQFAIENNIPLTRTENANAPEVLELLRSLQPECLGVIAFGQKLSDELLASAPRGGINLHSSLLPKYRGAAPINWAVINDDPEAGVCVIEVTSKMDAGDVLAKAATPIGLSETAGELHDRLAELGAPLLPLVLDGFAGGMVERVRQDAAQATRAQKLSRDMAWVDFTKDAPVVSARIRGMSPWPGVQVELMDPTGGRRIHATIVQCIARDSGRIHAVTECGEVLGDRTIACGTGSLEVLLIQPEGKKAMDLQAFANGYGFQKGWKARSRVAVGGGVIPPGK